MLAVYGHAGGKLLDSVVVSTSRISPALRRRYAEQNATPIENDIGVLEQMGLSVIGSDLLQNGLESAAQPGRDRAARSRRIGASGPDTPLSPLTFFEARNEFVALAILSPRDLACFLTIRPPTTGYTGNR